MFPLTKTSYLEILVPETSILWRIQLFTAVYNNMLVNTVEATEETSPNLKRKAVDVEFTTFTLILPSAFGDRAFPVVGSFTAILSSAASKSTLTLTFSIIVFTSRKNHS